MNQMLSMLRPALVLLLAFMVVAVDFTSYLLSAVGDLFFVGRSLFWFGLRLSQPKSSRATSKRGTGKPVLIRALLPSGAPDKRQ
jgi:hypothetical protein